MTGISRMIAARTGALRRDWRLWAIGGALAVCAYFAYLWRLGEGAFHMYDEGLYGQLARNALESGTYLFAADANGEFSTRYSKPPLAIWSVALSFKALGPSFFALRLPFAICNLITAGACFAWGRRLGGTRLGVLWCFGLLVCAGSYYWQRTATIEAMFVCWLVVALWAYGGAVAAEDRRAALLWAMIAGIAFTLGFFTKQVAVLLGVVAVVGLEVLRRDSLREWMRRLVPAIGIPVVAGGVWFVWAYVVVGNALIRHFIGFTVVQRMQGFAGTTHFRTLNRLANTLADLSTPFPWVVGILAVFLWAVWSRWGAEGKRQVGEVWLLPLFLLVLIVVYGNLSKSMLPWYVLAFVPIVVGGCAWTADQLWHEVRGWCSSPTELPWRTCRAGVAAVLGALCVVQTVVTATHRLWSQVNLVVILALVVFAFALAMERAVDRRLLRAGGCAVLAVVVLLLVAGALGHPKHRSGVDRYAPMMEVTADLPSDRVYFANTAGLHPYEWRTFFGPRAHEVARPPWSASAPGPFAFVTASVLPSEARMPSGIRIYRSAGATAFLGTAAKSPWDGAACEAVLRQGGLTYEAEHLNSGQTGTVVTDDAASGGRLRRVRPWLNQKLEPFVLSAGPYDTFPPGRYRATLDLAWGCGGFNFRVAEIEVVAAGQVVAQRAVHCGMPQSGRFSPVVVVFGLAQPASLNVRLRYVRGTLEHDRTVLERLSPVE